MNSEMHEPLVLVLGTAEWDAPIATNQHYVVRELAHEFNVVFAEGLGTRRLRLTHSDIRRVINRLKRIRSANTKTNPSRTVPERASIMSPFALPFHNRISEPFNRMFFRRAFTRWVRYRGPKALWTYTPYTYGLESFADFTVYHLVDLIHRNQGVSQRAFLRNERRLAPRTNQAVGTSNAIGEHLNSQGFREVTVRLNVADVEIFSRATDTNRPRHPVVIFGGNLRKDKLDVGLLRDLTKGLEGIATLELVGPSTLNGDNEEWLSELRRLGAKISPPMSLEELAKKLVTSSVGIIPYAINDLTVGVSPLKTYEYLAAGLPAVCTPLPSITPVDGAIWVESTRSEFIERVKGLLANEIVFDRTGALDLAGQHSWERRGEILRQDIRNGLGNRSLRDLQS